MPTLNTFESVLAVVLMMGGTWWVCGLFWDVLAAWWQGRSERRERRRRDAGAARNLESLSSVARAIRREDRSELSARIARDMAQRGYTPAAFHFPAESQAREKPALSTEDAHKAEERRHLTAIGLVVDSVSPNAIFYRELPARVSGGDVKHVGVFRGAEESGLSSTRLSLVPKA